MSSGSTGMSFSDSRLLGRKYSVVRMWITPSSKRNAAHGSLSISFRRRPAIAPSRKILNCSGFKLASSALAKQAIVDFVGATTEQGSPKLVPPEERIATFDHGTLWVSHPMYTQVMYCLERVPALAEKKPELKKVEPFKTVLSGNREAIASSR